MKEGAFCQLQNRKAPLYFKRGSEILIWVSRRNGRISPLWGKLSFHFYVYTGKRFQPILLELVSLPCTSQFRLRNKCVILTLDL
jgi:hypothetical protein